MIRSRPLLVRIRFQCSYGNPCRTRQIIWPVVIELSLIAVAAILIAPGSIHLLIDRNRNFRKFVKKCFLAFFELYPKRFIKNRRTFRIMWLHEGDHRHTLDEMLSVFMTAIAAQCIDFKQYTRKFPVAEI